MTGGCSHTTAPSFDGVWCDQCAPELTPVDPRVIACARALHEQMQTRLIERLPDYVPQPWEGLAEPVRTQMASEAIEIVAAIDAADQQHQQEEE